MKKESNPPPPEGVKRPPAPPAPPSKRVSGHERVVMCDPTCGNCGKPKSKHYFEFWEVFCFTHTTGDIFTDTPQDEMIFNMILEDHPGMYEQYLDRWQKSNGHT